MFKNYLKIAWRNLKRNRSYAAINILGLATGLAACLLMLAFILHELSYDRFHKKADQLYRVVISKHDSNDLYTGIPDHIGPDLASTYPEVQKTTGMQATGTLMLEANGKRFYESNGNYVTPTFFDLFTFNAIEGNLQHALQSPQSIAITNDFARKYFGRTDVIGQSITTHGEERMKLNTSESGSSIKTIEKGPTTYRIEAVVQSPPSNSSVQFDFVVPFKPGTKDPIWWNFSTKTYLQLNPNAEVKNLEKKLSSYAGQNTKNSDKYGLLLQPLTEMHLHPQLGRSEKTGPMQYIYIFGVAALLILLIACINYMNLSTAQTAQRAREIGVRKVAGAHRGQIIRQLLSESVLIALSAMVIALPLAELLLPLINSALGLSLTLGFLYSVRGMAILLGLILFVGILSGSYGAIVLSKFKPVHVIKGLQAKESSSGSFRKALVVAQFATSIALILASVIIYKQMDFVRSERLNVKGEQVLLINDREGVLDGRYQPFKKKLLAQPSVEQVTAGQQPGEVRYRTHQKLGEMKKSTMVSLMLTEYDYLNTLGYKLVKGTDFRHASVGNPDSTNMMIINETATQMADLEDKVGQKVQLNGEGILVGIVKDFYMESMFKPVGPLQISFNSGAKSTVLIRLKQGEIARGLQQTQQVWNDIIPKRPMDYSFLDEELDKQYRAELQLEKLFGGFTLLAVFVACLGLFGLAAYTAQRRTKEIGIRKVLGASVTNIVGLLSKDFLKLVAIGFAIAVPIAWYAMNKWLADFAYKIDIGPGIFLLAGALALVIALLTVSGQSIRAALANPVDSLKSE